MAHSVDFGRSRLQTTFLRALAALAAGSGAGAATTGVVVLGLFWIGQVQEFGAIGLLTGAVMGVLLGLYAVIFSFWVWAAGAVLFGAPLWGAIHLCGGRNAILAILVGVVAPFIGWGVLSLLVESVSGDPFLSAFGDLFLISLLGSVLAGGLPALIGLCGIGGIVGWVVWRVAYREDRGMEESAALRSGGRGQRG